MLLTIPGLFHEVSLDLLSVGAVCVSNHQRVHPVEDVCRVVQLQTAVVFSLCDVMDHRHDVVALLHLLIIPIPLKIWLGVCCKVHKVQLYKTNLSDFNVVHNISAAEGDVLYLFYYGCEFTQLKA